MMKELVEMEEKRSEVERVVTLTEYLNSLEKVIMLNLMDLSSNDSLYNGSQK